MTFMPNLQVQPTTPQATTAPRVHAGLADDEIDLVELGVGIWRKRGVIIGTTLVCLALSAVFALLTPKQYEYSAALQIGSIADANGQLQPIISPDAALTLLNKVVLPKVVDDYSKAHDLKPQDLKVEATLAGSIVLAGKGPQEHGADIAAIESAAAAELAKITASQLESRLTALRQQAALAESELQLLQASSNGANAAATKPEAVLQFLNQTKILVQKTLASSLQTQLKSVQPTRLLSSTVRSTEPIGASRAVIVVLGGVLGVFFGLFAALMSGYLAAVRQHMVVEAGAAPPSHMTQAKP
jgi:LPS O-antigen subunit length determinant protein (WzzB/FepE family)